MSELITPSLPLKEVEMKIPKDVIDRIDRLEKERQRRAKAETRIKRRNALAASKLLKLKRSRIDELILCAHCVYTWINEFVNSGEGRKLVAQLGIVGIFCAPFWQGYPAPESAASTFATLEIDKDGNVFYLERYKWMPSRELLVGRITFNPTLLIEKLHPDYLAQLAEHVKSGAVWNYIKSTLPKKLEEE